jgi:DNA-binding LytR/AlgR family response regulator
MTQKIIKSADFIQVRISGGYKIIPVDSIVYVKAQGKFTIIFHRDLSTLVTFHVLKWYYINLTRIDFFRCHKSFLINLRYVNHFTSKEIVLINNIKIPISRDKMDSFKENLKVVLIA